MEHSIPCLKEGLQHLSWLHFQHEHFHESEFNLTGLEITRSALCYCSLSASVRLLTSRSMHSRRVLTGTGLLDVPCLYFSACCHDASGILMLLCVYKVPLHCLPTLTAYHQAG